MTDLRTFAFVHPLTAEQLGKFQAAFPQIEFLASEAGLPRGIERAQAVAMHWAAPPVAEVINAATGLEWLHLRSTGIDNLDCPQLIHSNIVLTNGSGNHAPNIAEHVLAMMLAFARQLPHFVRAQGRKAWEPVTQNRVFEVSGQHLLLLGLGSIGQELAKLAKALGMRVTGVRRSATHEPLPNLDEVVTLDRLDDVLTVADHVAVSLPLTGSTNNILSAERLARLKQGAYLYNVGRGRLIDQDALVSLLMSGHLGGAGLDVTEPEPLPESSVLWTLPNVLITAHTAGATPRSYERFEALVIENIRRFSTGSPMLNVVDKLAGY